MGRKTALKKRLVPVWVLCVAAAEAAVLMIAVLRTPAEKAVLQTVLPGEWKLHAGGGPDTLVFMADGTARKQPNDPAVPGRLACADEAQHRDIWTHPRLVLILGDSVCGIHLGLEGLLNAAKGKKLIVTVEEHAPFGGLGSMVAQVISAYDPKKVINLALPDTPVITGTSHEVFDYYGLNAAGIVDTVKKTLEG